MSNKKKRQGNSKKRVKKQSKLSRILGSTKLSSNLGWPHVVKLTPAEVSHQFRRSYFLKLTPSEVRSNIGNIACNHHFSAAIKLTVDGDCSDVYKGIIPDTKLLNSLNWIIGLIVYHKDIINKYIKLEDLVTKSILNENYDEALSLLDQIDDLCGVSTWSITIRGSVLSISDQYEKSQEFLKSIITKSNDNELFKSICRHLINRHNDSSMHVSSGIALRNQITRSIDGELQSFLIYKLVPKDFAYNYRINYEDILNFEKNSSLIDAFKAVISFISSALDSEEIEITQAAKFAAETLSPHMSYHILDGLLAYYGIVPDWEFKSTDFSLIDAYTIGDYVDVCDRARRVSNGYFDFALFELISKASARTGINPFTGLLNYILSNLVNILLKQDGYQKSLTDLLAICHAFSGIPWFQELHFIISRESSFIDQKSHDHLILLSSVYSKVNSPRKSESFPIGLSNDFFISCNRKIHNSISVKLFEILKDNKVSSFEDPVFSGIEVNRLRKYKAKILVSNGMIDEAISILEQLSKCEDRISAYDANRLLVEAYIDTNQGEKALELFVCAAMSNRNVVLRFNSYRICEVAKLLINKSSSICVPIALSLHSIFVDDSYDSALRYSFEKYLQTIGVVTPIDIVNKIEEIGKDKVHYFLEYVCIPDVMKLSFIFETKQDIENCRIAICAYLIENNISKTLLVNEVKKITKDQVIRKAVTQVDHSRIYADTGGFVDSKSIDFVNIFERYIKLNRNYYSSYDDEKDLNKLYVSMIDSGLVDKFYTLHLLGVSLNEKNSTFHKLISMMRDEFTFGHKGLNSYLSTRIRHGVLPNTIRGCVSGENLVTAINPKSKIPKNNEYWRNSLSFISEEKWEKIERAFSKFTVDFERIINEINDEWLQVVSLDQDIKSLQKGGAKDKAIFDYSISNLETYALQKMLGDGGYDEYVKIVTSWLWRRTEINLKSVKNMLSSDASDRFIECYTKLLESINSTIDDKTLLVDLHDAVNRSKDSLNTALNLINSWFTRSEFDVIKEFELTTSVDIAVIPASVKVEYKSPSNAILFDGRHLTSFVDIFYILFENAVSNSQLNRDDLLVSVDIDYEEGADLIIKVSNNCKEIDDIEVANNELDYYRKAYGDESLINQVVQQEGGTGIFKIWKILSKDIEVNHSLELGYENNNLFVVKIVIHESNRVLCDENTNS